MTFEDLEKITLKAFNKNGHGFQPSDLIDQIDDGDDGDDEILRKYNPIKKKV